MSRSEHEAVKKKVTTLEKRIRVLEGRAVARGKGGKGARKAGRSKHKSKSKSKTPRPRGTVAVTGDAIAVFVASERHRLPVPGEIREGTFKALATFETGASPTTIGPIEIKAGKTTTVHCSATHKRCKVSEPE